MIRVLQVLPRLRRGGSQAMVMSLYRELDKTQFQFDFIIFTPDHDDYYDEIKMLGGKIYHFLKFNGKNFFSVCKEWENFFVEHPEYRIIHSHVRSFASIYLPIAKRHGLKTIIHSHSTSNGKGYIGIIKSILEYPLRFQADYLFSCSTEAGKWLFGEKAVFKNNYYFIPNSILVEQFLFSDNDRNHIREQLGIKDELVIGHVGGFETPKNHTFLLECFRYLSLSIPTVQLLLVGDGTFEEQLKNLCIKNRLLDRVHFVGLQANVAPYLSAMDLFVFPSLWEGLPVSVVEAQASGLKCLLSDTITRDVELSDLLYYFPLNKGSQEWAKKIISMVPNKRTPASDINLEKLDAFDCKKTIRKLENFYSSCI